jgi:hypothetical protein
MTSSASWYCPLYKHVIPDGLCLDINYARLGFFKPGTLEEVTQATGIPDDLIAATCITCPNQPLGDETQTGEADT